MAYFCGCFNGAVIVSKYILHDDVRTHGSGNAGLTNFYRTFGGPLTFVVILCDVLKAVAAISFSKLIAAPIIVVGSETIGFALAEYWAGLFCLLGHMFPCMFHFKGGKGILSGGAIAIMIDLAHRPGGVGRLPPSGGSDPVCVPGLLLGRGQLPLRHLVCVSRRVFDRVRRLFGLSDPVHAPGQHPAAALGNRKQFSLHHKKE